MEIRDNVTEEEAPNMDIHTKTQDSKDSILNIWLLVHQVVAADHTITHQVPQTKMMKQDIILGYHRWTKIR